MDDSIKSIPQLFFSRVIKYGGRCALRVKRKTGYEDISWDEFGRVVWGIAYALMTSGIKHGDRAGLLSENRPEWAYADLGIQTCGAISVPIYATNTANQIEQILLDCKARILFVSNEEQLTKVNSIRKNLPFLENIVVFDKLEEFMKPFNRLALFTGHPESTIAVIEEDDIATIIYTSGTTGEPKGAMLTHKNFLSNCKACSNVLPIDDNDIYLSFLPLSHVFERMAGFYLMISKGVTIAYAENLETVPQNIIEVCPTIMCGVPRFYEKIYTRIREKLPHSPFLRKLLLPIIKSSIKKKLGGRLRFFVSGGAPLSREIAEFFFSFGVMILEGYGLTETSPVIAVNSLKKFKFGSVGLPVAGAEVRIAQDGEILTRGPHIMKGYYNRQDWTDEVIKDGWFYTGDIGYIDNDGFLFITDRKKELIVTSGGKNIAPQKIENLLTSDEHISQVFVYGDRHNYLVALIVPNFNALKKFAESKKIPYSDNADLIKNDRINDLIRQRLDACSNLLAAFEQIKYFALLEKEFSQSAGELTPTLKLKRRVIEAKYKELLESLYKSL